MSSLHGCHLILDQRPIAASESVFCASIPRVCIPCRYFDRSVVMGKSVFAHTDRQTRTHAYAHARTRTHRRGGDKDESSLPQCQVACSPKRGLKCKARQHIDISQQRVPVQLTTRTTALPQCQVGCSPKRGVNCNGSVLVLVVDLYQYIAHQGHSKR